jgi:hypothetical protein
MGNAASRTQATFKRRFDCGKTNALGYTEALGGSIDLPL